MSIRTGTWGLVQVGANTVASLQNWTLEHTRESADITVLGTTGYRDTLATFGAWSVSAEGFWDPDDTTGQVAIETAMIAGTTVVLKLYPSATSGAPAAGDVFYTGSALVTSYNIGGSFDNAVTASLGFSGDGALTRDTQ